MNNNFGYLNQVHFIDVDVQYGTEAFTECKVKDVILAEEDIDKFNYLNNNSDVELKLVEGFIDNGDDYVKLRGFDSWTGDTDGVFDDNFQVSSQIPSITKGETHVLKYNVRQRIGYLEVLPKTKLVSHYFFSKAKVQTKNSVLTYNIPAGSLSKIVKLKLEIKRGSEVLFKKEVRDVESKVIMLENVGTLILNRKKRNYKIHWTITKNLLQGDSCVLTWYTERYKP